MSVSYHYVARLVFKSNFLTQKQIMFYHRAVNAAGEAVTSTSVRCVSKSSLLLQTLHPESLPRIRQLEEHPEVPTQELEVDYGPPHFVTTLRNQEDIQEGAIAHFECRLEPSRDPTMRMEWFHNGNPDIHSRVPSNISMKTIY